MVPVGGADAARGSGAPRAPRLLVALSAALALATLLRLPAAWESGNALNHVSGAWLTLADDLARGTFYRPLHDAALGYGGTRFFPLAFALEAALARAGLGLVAAGYAASLAAGALLLVAAFLLLRRLGQPRAPAAAFAALALAGFAAQHALASARGDLLPVALSAAALASLAPAPSRGRLALAAVLFALAFAAKPTALTAPAAAVAWLALRRDGRSAAALAGAVAALAAAALLVTEALSGARFLEILRACASGGASLGHALRAPVRAAHQLAVADRAGLVLVLAAAAATLAAAPALLRAARRGAPSPLALPALWLAAALAGVLAVFASPGTGVNHFVELEAAAALALGAAALEAGRASRLARTLAPAAAAAGLLLAVSIGFSDRGEARLADVRAVLALLPAGPVLSEDPLVPLVAGERPIVQDAFMLRLLVERDPALRARLEGELARGAYAAIVLFQDLDAAGAESGDADRNLGLPLVAELRRRYRRVAAAGRYHVYVPRAPEAVPDGGTREPRLPAAPPPASVAPASVVPGAAPR